LQLYQQVFITIISTIDEICNAVYNDF
jgi:hypothetical protein